MWRDLDIEIPDSLDGARADAAVLALFPDSSRRAVAKAFADGAVRVWPAVLPPALRATPLSEGGGTRGALRATPLSEGGGTRGALCATSVSEGGVSTLSALAKGARVRAGQCLHIDALYAVEDLRVAPEPGAPLTVVYLDDNLVGVSKPAGQACHPIDFDEPDTLAAALVARFPETAALGDDPLAPGLLHRIDGGTSGLVLAARTAHAYTAVRAQFEAQTVVKEYRALVAGCVERPGAVSGLLAHSWRGGEMRMVRATPGHHGARALRAETYFRPLVHFRRGVMVGTLPQNENPFPEDAVPRSFDEATLLAVTIRTGVTHQIRSQLAEAGHPVVGDVLYGAKAVPEWRAGTHALHSWSAEFVHPATGRRITVRAPEAPRI